jgi:hypothetical protein
MRSWKRKTPWVLSFLVFLAMGLYGLGQNARHNSDKESSPNSEAVKSSAEPALHVPPYYKNVKAAEPLPPVLPASRFAGRPVVVCAYQIAARIPKVLAQEPCYCGCDRHFGHHSLLDCYASDHTAGCAVCVQEAFLAYELHKQGKTPAQIRAAIMRGDWRAVDINHPPELRP